MTIKFDEDRQNQKLTDLVHKEEEDLVQLLSWENTASEYLQIS